MLSQKSKARDFVCKTCVRKGHLYALPDVAIPATLCRAPMNCESVSTGFAFGYCCHIYYSITQNCCGLSFQSFFCGSNAPLVYVEGVYNLSKPKMFANSSLTAKPEVCWTQLSFLTSSCDILVTYPCWNEWFFISNLE